MKASTHRLCTANRPSPLATPQPPHPPTAPEAASRRGRHGCGATPPRGCRLHNGPALATRHWELAATHWTEFESNYQSPTAPGESCARLPAGLLPHRHWCLCWSTWSAQKKTVGMKGWQFVAAPLASDFCKSDHLQLSISHVWPFNVVKCCARDSRDNGPSHSRIKQCLSTSWPNIATKFARRGTMRSLLLLNWSTWHRAASARQRTEFESKGQSSTSPGETGARLPGGQRRHRHWCHSQSTWSAQKRTVGDIQPRGRAAYRKGYVYAMQAPILQKPRLCGG